MTKEERTLAQIYSYRVNKLKKRGREPIEDFETFKKFSTSVSQAKGESLIEAGKRRLRSISYVSSKEAEHFYIMSILKEQGLTTRLYRMGGKTAFDTFQCHDEYKEKYIEDRWYKTYKFYTLGNVIFMKWYDMEGDGFPMYELISNEGISYIKGIKFSFTPIEMEDN